MVQADGGGGGGGNAGPLETKLIQAYAANLEAVRGAAASWVNGQVLLDGVARGLKTQAQLLETTFGKNNPTGMAAAERYREVQAKVEKRANEMKTAAQALQHTRDGLVAAQADYDALPKVTTNPNAPQSDLEKLMDPGGQMRQAQYDGERQARERAAGQALDRLDTHFEKSATDLRTVAGDAPDRGGNGGGGGGGGGTSPLVRSSGGGTTVATGGPSGSGGSFHHNEYLTGGHVDGPREHGGNDDGPAWEGPDFGNNNPTGTLSGPTTSPDYTGPGNSGSYGGSATPTSGSGAGVASALGAGVAGGAGAIAASRGGVPATRAVGAPGTSSGAIGKSSSTARGGAIGRGGTTVPGQSTQARTGAGGRGGAGGRSGMAGGQTQRSGGKGGAGGRAGRAGAAGAAGSTQGRRGGKKDENDVTQEHLAFADEESWLDDEGAHDSVID